MKGVWSDGEVKDLFKQVQEFKLAGKPTKDAFLQHAKTYGRKANSVRNYYYHELDSLTSTKKINLWALAKKKSRR